MNTTWRRLPRLETASAIAVVSGAYGLRVAAIATATRPTQWLTLTTDLLLPAMAGAWLWTVAMAAVIDTYDRRH